MPIKINHVRVFKGTHTNVHAEYYQVLGIFPIKFGQAPKVGLVLECTIEKLNATLIEIKNRGYTFKPDEKRVRHEVWIPYRDRGPVQETQDARAD